MKKEVVWLIALLSMSAVGFSLFNCTTETCTWNGTSNTWNCEYLGCPTKPDFIINKTVINTEVINLTTVNYTCKDNDIIKNLTATITQGNKQILGKYDEVLKDFNYTKKYSDVYSNWKSCTEAYQELLNQTNLFFKDMKILILS